MGKYSNSKIHDIYSDFHWKLIELGDIYRQLYVSDIDRMWIEFDLTQNTIVGVIDIKWENLGDTITPTEDGIYNWFRKQGVRVFIVYINENFTKFTTVNEKGIRKEFNQLQYADFLLSLRSPKRFRRFLENYEGYIDIGDQLNLFI